MATRRRFIATIGVTLAAGCTTDDGAGSTDGDGDFSLSSPAFDDDERIPTRYTADGSDVSPALEITGVPEDARSLVLVVDDPDAPSGSFAHWLLWNVPPGTDQIPEDVPTEPTLPDLGGARQGENDFGSVGYRGPAPPAEDDPHRYRFTLSAVERELDVEAGASRSPLESEMEGDVLAAATLTGRYGR